MAPTMTSTYYFDANATSQKDFFQGIPMFAVHAGGGNENGWESAGVTSKAGFDFIAAKMNPQVPVHIAMPRSYAGRYFTKDREYSKVAIYAFRPVPGSSWQSDGGYMVGASIALVLKQVKVMNVVPIPQWKGLPSIPQVQRNHLEKLIGRETYIPVAVTCFVMQGDVVA